ncbi:MAG TPA: nucleotidyltransferase [Pantanalinema sp.]
MFDAMPEARRLLASGPPAATPQVPDDHRLLSAGHEACEILTRAGVPYMVGGGVAVWAYGRRRCTKDIDLFLPPKIPFVAMDALGKHGFHTRDTDASWLYKAFKYGVLIDLIVWTTGNVRLDAETFARTRVHEIDGRLFTLMGPEDVLFRKILSHREERRDWYDGLSMLSGPPIPFDWAYFLGRIRPEHARRTLSFALYAQADLGVEAVPGWVVASLLKDVPLGA